jgi:hypothetical protein
MYAMQENPYEDATSERDSYAEFVATLRREPTPTNEAMQKGIDFENLVTDIMSGCGDPSHGWYEAATSVSRIIKNGVLQFKARREIEVSGVPILLHGRLDALKAGIIFDIKFSGSYEIGKYLDSTQHPTYFELVPEAKEFMYLVSNGTNVWPEGYSREETPSIIPVIEDFLKFLKRQGLIETFAEKWVAL